MVAIPKISALFETSLASAMTAAASSFTVVSGTDRDGNALSGLYGFIIDEGTSDEEFAVGTISSTTVTITARGLDADDPVTEVSGNKKAHRRGASIKITDYPILAYLRNILDNTSGYSIPNGLTLAGILAMGGFKITNLGTPVDNTDAATKAYADTISSGGGPDANETTKGFVEEATQAEVEAGTATGGTGANLFVAPDKLRAKRFHSFAADAGANDAYAITVSPTIAAYTDGDVFVFEAATVNTGNATLNVNSVGAKNILKYGNVTLADGDIKAGSIVMVVYDADSDTFMLLSAVANAQLSQTGKEIYGADAVGTDSYAVTLTPAPAAYIDGLMVNFKAGTANTGAATLNVNGLGAVAIKKLHDRDLETGDIEANQIVTVVYNSSTAKFQMVSQLAQEETKFPNTEVFNNTAPTSYTDLDLSSVVGARQRTVMLSVVGSGVSDRTYHFRKNGETIVGAATGDSGVTRCIVQASEIAHVIVVTDTAGVIEWICSSNPTTVIKVESYW